MVMDVAIRYLLALRVGRRLALVLSITIRAPQGESEEEMPILYIIVVQSGCLHVNAFLRGVRSPHESQSSFRWPARTGGFGTFAIFGTFGGFGP